MVEIAADTSQCRFLLFPAIPGKLRLLILAQIQRSQEAKVVWANPLSSYHCHVICAKCSLHIILTICITSIITGQNPILWKLLNKRDTAYTRLLPCSFSLLTTFLASVHHLLNIVRDCPACNIPGVENTTIGPGLSI